MADQRLPELNAGTPIGTTLIYIRPVGQTRDRRTTLATAIAGAGGVTKVGAPVDNQVAVFTADGVIEGVSNFRFTGSQFLIPNANSAATPDLGFTGDSTTGLFSPATLSLGLSAGAVEAIRFAGASSNVIASPSSNVGLTADVGSAQGNGVILSSYNVYSIVANAGDAATLPATFIVGATIYVKNDGANSMEVFPASGDDAGAGANTAVAVAAGGAKTFIATVANTTWTELIVSGDVTKVGTPANTEIGIWTGDGTIEGNANFTFTSSQVLIPNANSAAAPDLAFTTDSTVGIFSPGSKIFGISVGQTEAARWDEVSAGQIIAAWSSNVGLTADVGSAQGNGVILSSYNVYSTVANAGDAATLPSTFIVGTTIYIKNDGANSMDVFPASGDDAGAGTDTAVAIPAGESKTFIATVADTTWTELLSAGGAGDVTKVGTPVDNQLGVWTGDGTLEGDTGLTWTGTILNVNGKIQTNNAAGAALLNEAAGFANPTVLADKGDIDTGIGTAGNDTFSIVAGEVGGTIWGEASGGIVVQNAVLENLTASVTQTQGQGALFSSYNEIGTVANANDTVTLPGAKAGSHCLIINSGANTLQIFPATSDDLGQGVNNSTTLAAGESVYFWTWDITTWHPIAGGAASAAYTRNATVVEDRTLLASASATILNNNNVLAALIADLQTRGIIQ